jgi:hypothetical protein
MCGSARRTLWDGFQTLPRLSNTSLSRGVMGRRPPAGRPYSPPKRSSDSPGLRDSNNRGQLSNPAWMALRGDDYGVNSPTAGRSTRRLGPPVQRRLTPSQLEAVAARYQSGRSLNDLAREFGVHHRTVAEHLESLGIARRVNLPKLSAANGHTGRHPISSWPVAWHRGQGVECRCVNRSASSQACRHQDPTTAWDRTPLKTESAWAYRRLRKPWKRTLTSPPR